MVRTELHGHMPLQGPKCYIPLEWACCLLVATVMGSVIGNQIFPWVCSPRLKRTSKSSYLTLNHGVVLREFLLIKLFIVT